MSSTVTTTNNVQKKDHLAAYYETNQQHLQWSFWSSLASLVIGLTALIAGIYLSLSSGPDFASSVTTIGGVLTQFIGAGFFFLYSRNLKQLNIFYQKLIENQDTNYAIGLVGHLPESERSELIRAIIGALLSRSGKSTDITPELVRAFAEAKHIERNP